MTEEGAEFGVWDSRCTPHVNLLGSLGGFDSLIHEWNSIFMSLLYDRLPDAHVPTGDVDELTDTFLPSQDSGFVPPTAAHSRDVPAELRTLTQYRIVRELGSGGMGQVFLALDLPLDREVVIKVVKTDRLQRSDTIDRFAREMRIAAKLHHSNIVAAYTSHQIGDFLAFVMEYVPGEDMAKQIKSHGRLSPVKAAFYASQVARGLKHAHEHNLVHRDVKPSNLILLKQGKRHVVKILDFGLAKARSEFGKGPNLTGAGCMLGTPEFVAPEQIRDAASADIRADLYSLGCTLYFLIVGEPPFRGRSEFELQESHVFKKAPRLDVVRSDVPRELADIVAKLLAKEPGERYQSPAELLTALTEYLRAIANPLLFEEDASKSSGASHRATPPHPTPPQGGREQDSDAPYKPTLTKTGGTTAELPELKRRRDRSEPQGPQEVPILRRPLTATPPAMQQLEPTAVFPVKQPAVPSEPENNEAEEREPSPSIVMWLTWVYLQILVFFSTSALVSQFHPQLRLVYGLQIGLSLLLYVLFACCEIRRFRTASWWLASTTIAVLAALAMRDILG